MKDCLLWCTFNRKRIIFIVFRHVCFSSDDLSTYLRRLGVTYLHLTKTKQGCIVASIVALMQQCETTHYMIGLAVKFARDWLASNDREVRQQTLVGLLQIFFLQFCDQFSLVIMLAIILTIVGFVYCRSDRNNSTDDFSYHCLKFFNQGVLFSGPLLLFILPSIIIYKI